MNKTDKRSCIPRLDLNVKNFFEEYLENCKAQNGADVNSFFNMISQFLLIRDEYNKLTHEICEAYFQLFVNPLS